MKNSKIGFAIGNGFSREHFDLRKLGAHGTTVGCNYIVREFNPDIVVSLDQKPFETFSQIAPEQRSWKWLTMKPGDTMLTLDGEPVLSENLIQEFYPKNNSGIIACTYLAEVLEVETVYMIGFDFFRIHPGMVRNEMYSAGLRKYRDFDNAFKLMSDYFSATEFIRVGPVHPHDVKYFKGLMSHIGFMDFLEFEVNFATDTI